jgi:hypothetical protein
MNEATYALDYICDYEWFSFQGDTNIYPSQR